MAWLFWLYKSNSENILKSGIKVFHFLLNKIEPSSFQKHCISTLQVQDEPRVNIYLLEIHLKYIYWNIYKVSLYKPVYSRFMHELNSLIQMTHPFMCVWVYLWAYTRIFAYVYVYVGCVNIDLHAYTRKMYNKIQFCCV